MARFSSRRAALVAVVASTGCVAAVGQVHAQGLFDFLFGGGPAPRQALPEVTYAPAPLEMHVRPRRARAEAPRREEKPKLATPIDPVKNPDWYLEDRTLRRGDIVVLKDRVLVFQGGRGGSLDDFASLDESRLSKAEQTRISQMAGLKTTPITTASAEAVAKPRSAKRLRSAKRSRTARSAPAETTLSLME